MTAMFNIHLYVKLTTAANILAQVLNKYTLTTFSNTYWKNLEESMRSYSYTYTVEIDHFYDFRILHCFWIQESKKEKLTTMKWLQNKLS